MIKDMCKIIDSFTDIVNMLANFPCSNKMATIVVDYSNPMKLKDKDVNIVITEGEIPSVYFIP